MSCQVSQTVANAQGRGQGIISGGGLSPSPPRPFPSSPLPFPTLLSPSLLSHPLPSPALPSPPFTYPFLPYLPLEVGPLIAARGSGGALKLPQRVRAEAGRQTPSGAFSAYVDAFFWQAFSCNLSFVKLLFHLASDVFMGLRYCRRVQTPHHIEHGP